MNKYNLNTLNGQINELVDNKNRLYKIPNYCINDPFFVKQIKKIDENHLIQTISISLYDVYDNKKTNINVSDNIKIEDLKKNYCDHNNIDITKSRIRLLFGGSELKDDNLLYQFNFRDGYIIQILKTNDN